MALMTMPALTAQMDLPIYVKITDEHEHKYQVGKTYEVQVLKNPDEPKGIHSDRYEIIHDGFFIGKEKMRLEDVPDILLAYAADTKSRDEAIQRLKKKRRAWSPETEIVVLFFLRYDKAKEMVMQDIEPEEPDHSEIDTYI